MSEMRFELKGMTGVVALVALLGIVGFRFLTLQDMRGDEALVAALEGQLRSEHYPAIAAQMQAAADSGDAAAIEKAASSVAESGVNIVAVEASTPLLDFSTAKDVVVKVTYSLGGAGGGEPVTRFYRYRHGAIGDAWRYEGETWAVGYYLNFM